MDKDFTAILCVVDRSGSIQSARNEYEEALQGLYLTVFLGAIFTCLQVYEYQHATFGFTEENGKIGDSNVLENNTTINLNDDNFITFGTRRNRKINFTEYYDLVYEYKNDCLVAGIKYKRSYYQDRDLKPKEDLLLSVTFFPLSQYEQKIDESAYRGDRSIFNILD